MVSSSVRIEGLQELKRKLSDLKSDVPQAANSAAQDAAQAVREDVRDNIRQDTGYLASSVEVGAESRQGGGGRRGRSGGANVWVGWRDPEAFYARFNEFGTQHRVSDPALSNAAERERGNFEGRLTASIQRTFPGGV